MSSVRSSGGDGRDVRAARSDQVALAARRRRGVAAPRPAGLGDRTGRPAPAVGRPTDSLRRTSGRSPAPGAAAVRAAHVFECRDDVEPVVTLASHQTTRGRARSDPDVRAPPRGRASGRHPAVHHGDLRRSMRTRRGSAWSSEPSARMSVIARTRNNPGGMRARRSSVETTARPATAASRAGAERAASARHASRRAASRAALCLEVDGRRHCQIGRGRAVIHDYA